MRPTICVIVLGLLSSTPNAHATTYSSQDWGQITPEERQLQAPSAYPNTGAVVIFDKGIAVAELSGVSFERHARVKIIDTTGIAKVTPVLIQCPPHDRITDVAALIHKADGSVQEIREKQTRKSEDKTSRSVTIPFPNLAPGDILEYRYTINYYGGIDKLGVEKYFLLSQAISYRWAEAPERKSIEWDEGLYKRISNLPSWFFDGPAYTLYSEMTVKLGGGLDYTCVPANVPVELQLPQSQRGSGIIDRVYKYHTWIMEDIPPADDEPFMPVPNEYRPSLHFDLLSISGEDQVIVGNYADTHWLNVGRNLQGYLDNYIKHPRQLLTDALTVTSGLPSALEKTKRLFEFVRGKYSSDRAGYCLRPARDNLRKFFNKKTGAPFESNLLLVEMLKVAGIEARPVLISTRDQVDFHTTARFNHALACARIDSGCVFMDASSKACPFGSLPPMSLIREGLLVDLDQSRLVPILASDPDNYRRDSTVLRFDSDSNVTTTTTCTLSGNPAMELGDYLEPGARDRRAFPRSPVVSDMVQWKDLNWRYDSLAQCLVQARVPLVKLPKEDTLLLTMPILSLLSSNPFTSPVRLQPVDFLYPFSYESKVVVPLGERQPQLDTAADTGFTTDGALFHRSTETTDSTITVVTRLEIRKSLFSPAEYAELRAFFEHACATASQPVVQTAGTIRP